MSLSLRGHAALVTGSTKGVGRAIVEAIAEAGADVVVHGRSRGSEAEELLKRCERAGVGSHFVAADLTQSSESARVLADRAFGACPTLDILVNNAGQYFDVPFEEMTVERLERTLRLNVVAPYFLTQAFAGRWVRTGTRGRVLMVGSVNGRLAEVDSTAYDTSKGALEMMVKTLCVALAPRGIRVNGLAPGLVRTPQTAWIAGDPLKAEWITRHTPNGRIPEADACGGGAAYLVSDAAEHVHGHTLVIDGGKSVWQQPEPFNFSSNPQPDAGQEGAS